MPGGLIPSHQVRPLQAMEIMDMRKIFCFLSLLLLAVPMAKLHADCDLKNAYDFGLSLQVGTVIIVTERLEDGSESCSGSLANNYSVGLLEDCESSGEPTGPSIDANSLTIAGKYTVTWRATTGSASCIKLCECD